MCQQETPAEMPLGGSEKLQGGITRRLSSVSRTATPASTLPTVNETSILPGLAGEGRDDVGRAGHNHARHI